MGEKTAAIPAKMTIIHFIWGEKEEYGFPEVVVMVRWVGGNASPFSAVAPPWTGVTVKASSPAAKVVEVSATVEVLLDLSELSRRSWSRPRGVCTSGWSASRRDSEDMRFGAISPAAGKGISSGLDTGFDNEVEEDGLFTSPISLSFKRWCVDSWCDGRFTDSAISCRVVQSQ